MFFFIACLQRISIATIEITKHRNLERQRRAGVSVESLINGLVYGLPSVGNHLSRANLPPSTVMGIIVAAADDGNVTLSPRGYGYGFLASTRNMPQSFGNPLPR